MACMARRSNSRPERASYWLKPAPGKCPMSTWINNWLRPEVFCTFALLSNSGGAQERSEYPKAPNSGHRLARPTRSPKALRLIDETCAVRFLQRGGQRPILLAVRPANRRDPTQMILRLTAVALLDLPQTVILPGQHMIRICFQGALVPDLRKLVVAEFAINNRSDWQRSDDRRGRAPSVARWRWHIHCGHRWSHRLRGNPWQKRSRRKGTAWLFWPWGPEWPSCPTAVAAKTNAGPSGQKKCLHHHYLLLQPKSWSERGRSI
jgi:hypothetical protein